MPLATIEQAIAAMAAGKCIILVDDEDRENEGDLVIAAEKITPEAINFMAKFGRGLICLSLTEEKLAELKIPMMVGENSAQFGTAFTVSIEARHGVSTGISAADRAHTVLVAVADDAKPADLVMPGHIFPLRARRGGVLVRTGQTEGSVDLARLAGLKPAAVICEILNDDGTMARMKDLEAFAAEHDLIIVSVADLIRYRLARDRVVELVLETPFPCEAHPDFRLRVYRDLVHGGEHLALVLGDVANADRPVPVRVQHQAVVGDVFRATHCGAGWQLHGALQKIAEEGLGVFVYLHSREWTRLDAIRKFVLHPSIAEQLEPSADSTTNVNRPAPAFRDLGLGAQIIADCGARKIAPLLNDTRVLVGLEGHGLEVAGTAPIPKPAWLKEPHGTALEGVVFGKPTSTPKP